MVRAVIVLAGLLAILGVAPLARATTADQLCLPTADPCNILADADITPGSILDFGNRAVIVKSSKDLDAGGGEMTILAGSLTIEPTARLLSAGGTISVATTLGDIQLLNGGSGASKIDVSADTGGGEIKLTAAGGLLVEGYLYAKGGTAGGSDNDGGTVTIVAQGGDVTVDNGGIATSAPGEAFGGTINIDALGSVSFASTVDVLSVAGGGQGGGGECTIVARQGDITLDELIDATGGGLFDGGSITLQAGGNMITSAKLDVTGGAVCGAAGSIAVSAGGDITFGGTLLGSGGGSITEGCGEDGASVDVSTDGAVAVNAPITVRGGAGDSAGGGGDVAITAGRSLTVAADIDASGGNDSASFAPSAGDGGDVTLTAGETLTVSADVAIDGGHASDGTRGDAGAISGLGCDVNVSAGANLSATGANLGSNSLAAGGQMVIAGKLTATDYNELSYRDPARAPDLSLATLVPPTVPILDVTLPGCGACGDGTLSPAVGEECDDGNTRGCDGCSPTCKLEACGNGVRECAEECDDGALNGRPGDQCDASCHTVPTVVQLLPGRPQPNEGCYVEWRVRIPGDKLFPDVTEECLDGDPACDMDGINDGGCSFRVETCSRMQDARLPNCLPEAIDYVKVNRPNPLHPSDAFDQTNIDALLGALTGLGMTVKTGSTVLHAGTPDGLLDHCSPPFELRVPHDPGRIGRRLFSIGAADVAKRRMRSNLLRLKCVPNPAVCGNGIVEPTEHCDDGNTEGCDGCSPGCHFELCGNGILDCGEQCDDGELNGTPGDGCSPTCTTATPVVRIPGGGAKPLDCGLEWAVELRQTLVDRKALPKTSQACSDNDPACDFDPLPGSCRFHVWACLGGADARLACAAQQVTSTEVLTPSAKQGGGAQVPRQALLAAFAELALPAGPGEECTRRVDVDVPVKKRFVFRTRARFASGKTDPDSLKLKCLPP